MRKNKSFRNPVAKHMHKANKPAVIASTRRSKLLDASLRDGEEDLANELLDSEIMYSDDALQGCLDDLGCSSISIADEEDGK